MLYRGDQLTISIFGGCDRLYLSPDASWTFSDINTTDYFSNLTQINGAPMMDLSACTTVQRFFNKCVLLQNVDVSKFNLKSCTDTSYMFNSCTALEVIDVSEWDVSKVQTMRCMFQTAQKANQGNGAVKVLDVSKWDTSSCTTMSYMFYGCGNIEELDISNFDVSNVTEFNHTFCDCYKIKSLDMSKWDTSKVDSFNAMFNDCNSIVTIDVSNFNTSNVISFSQMFESMTSLECIIGLENFDTSNGQNFGEMFRYCNNLKELNLSSFDTSKATHTYKHPNSEYGLKNMFGPELYHLEKVTLGEKWTFLGDGGCTNGYFPTPSADYISDADGNWYKMDGSAYASTNVPSLTAATYYASPTLAVAALWEVNDKKYLSLNGIRIYHDLHNAEIDTKLEVIRGSIAEFEEITTDEVTGWFA